MNTEEDEDLKSLREGVLASMRSKKDSAQQAAGLSLTRDIFDTDIDDLEALRRAALRSLRDQSSTSNEVGRGSFTVHPRALNFHAGGAGASFSSQRGRGVAGRGFSRFPAPRSNLIVIQTLPSKEDANSLDTIASNLTLNKVATPLPKLVLPQDRYSKRAVSPSLALTNTGKKNDKFSRYEEESSSSYSDDSDAESTGSSEHVSNSGLMSPNLEAGSSPVEICTSGLQIEGHVLDNTADVDTDFEQRTPLAEQLLNADANIEGAGSVGQKQIKEAPKSISLRHDSILDALPEPDFEFLDEDVPLTSSMTADYADDAGSSSACVGEDDDHELSTLSTGDRASTRHLSVERKETSNTAVSRERERIELELSSINEKLAKYGARPISIEEALRERSKNYDKHGKKDRKHSLSRKRSGRRKLSGDDLSAEAGRSELSSHAKKPVLSSVVAVGGRNAHKVEDYSSSAALGSKYSLHSKTPSKTLFDLVQEQETTAQKQDRCPSETRGALPNGRDLSPQQPLRLSGRAETRVPPSVTSASTDAKERLVGVGKATGGKILLKRPADGKPEDCRSSDQGISHKVRKSQNLTITVNVEKAAESGAVSAPRKPASVLERLGPKPARATAAECPRFIYAPDDRDRKSNAVWSRRGGEDTQTPRNAKVKLKRPV